jgi:hypothetical protein
VCECDCDTGWNSISGVFCKSFDENRECAILLPESSDKYVNSEINCDVDISVGTFIT